MESIEGKIAVMFRVNKHLDTSLHTDIQRENVKKKIGSLWLHVAYCACYYLEYRI